jgi:hypothetical protein
VRDNPGDIGLSELARVSARRYDQVVLMRLVPARDHQANYDRRLINTGGLSRRVACRDPSARGRWDRFRDARVLMAGLQSRNHC